ncbi:NAD(P)-binding protein [Didymella exigua CBS 183.55]|uniref:NAD(P)-binding protein n=1 Tax=Didymella exigua CBS 183.55 TaxID=1150837 RepID=A0A6A5RW82_9PLEO|nr:NAD(P)-binding protein [Didymella exigua CBS 183.55]KAF1930546.1 NAD(P)-binding protein [Didymella exigua CBS 183.55]
MPDLSNVRSASQYYQARICLYLRGAAPTQEVTNAKPFYLPGGATWFITGCPDDIGKALAQHIGSKPYHRLVATARNPSDISCLPDNTANILKITLDVTSPIAQFGTIDVFINNAGYALSGDTESANEAEWHDVMETNFFGTVRTTTAVLLHMRHGSRGGLIINISSLLVCWTESVTKEVRQEWGVSFCIVEPSAVETNFEEHSKNFTAQHPAYADSKMPARILERYVDAGLKPGAGMKPEDVATVLYETASKGEKVPLHLPLSMNAFDLIKEHFESRLKALEEVKEASGSLS